jgi:hypothetical protein
VEAIREFESRKLQTPGSAVSTSRAYIEAGAFPEAEAQLEICLKRRGEARGVSGRSPSYRYLAPVYYYLGRAQEGLKPGGADLATRPFWQSRADRGILVADAAAGSERLGRFYLFLRRGSALRELMPAGLVTTTVNGNETG